MFWSHILRQSIPIVFFYINIINVYRGADKSLARPGTKQTNVSVRMA